MRRCIVAKALAHFEQGFNAYLQGFDLDPHASMAWRQGWLAAERDAYSYWYSLSEKEMALMGDKEGNS